jgi:peptidoglycan hydrolase-like protein with peptidoglycan-binding domain
MAAAEQAFMALSEADRKTIQQDLGFATQFNGAALGTFGSLTFNGIQAFEREQKLAIDGILTAQERQTLATIARNARNALKFVVSDDPRSGARIGVPQTIFVKREPNTTGGSRWQTADGKATLDSTALPKDGETLQQLFERATLVTPNRKVTYKLLRPDFFVVTGETTTGKFYRRVTLGEDGSKRGFSIGYDKALGADMDRLVISIANHFDAFPKANAPTSAPPIAAAPVVAPAPLSPASPPQPATPRERLATGLLLEGGHILSSAAVLKDCRTTSVGVRRTAARIVATDTAAGLILLKTDEQGRSVPVPSAGGAVAVTATLTAVGFAWTNNQPAGVFSDATATGNNRVAAPLQPGGGGTALFTETGALAGLVIDDPGARRQIAGVVPAARYRFATADEISAFLQKHNLALGRADGAKLNGAVAAARRESVTSLVCAL